LREELASARAQAYLDERAIPPDIAQAAGIGYLSRAAAEEAPVPDEQRHLLSRWIGRIVFPLGSPDGRGFIGRTLVRWEPGMDENEHKALLEAEGIKRWIKTNPAGWFGPHPSRFAPTLVLVEGGFDRLACIAAGITPQALVALVGTAAKVEWIVRFAPQVSRIVLALDGDEGGLDAMERLADEFQKAGLAVACCPPPSDGYGKDWSGRYRKGGQSGIWPLIKTITDCQHEFMERSFPCVR
jgi:DNA primase